jgi:hypothetical protein
MKKDKAPNDLPAPAILTPTVRERTLTHVRNLMRNTTTVGAGIALACGVTAPGCKYHVVDPPPPPPPGACVNPNTLVLDYCVQPEARWQKAGRKWTIDLNLRVQWGIDNMSFEGLTKDEIRVSGASVKNMNIGHQNFEAVLTPIKGKTLAELDLAVRCNNTQIPYRLKLALSKPRKKKGIVLTELIK